MDPLSTLVVMHALLLALVIGVRAAARRVCQRAPRAATFCARTVVAILAIDLVIQAVVGYRLWQEAKLEPGGDQATRVAQNLAIALNAAPSAIVLVAATLCALGAVALARPRR
jgi:hypothetical protein